MAPDRPHHCTPGMLADCPVLVGRPGQVTFLEVAECDAHRVRDKVRVPKWSTSASGTEVVLKHPSGVALPPECVALASYFSNRLFRPIGGDTKGSAGCLLALAAVANQNVVGIALKGDGQLATGTRCGSHCSLLKLDTRR
jgi:hypothetical protein